MRVVDIHVNDVNELVQTVFSGLSTLVTEDVGDEGGRVVVRARTPEDAAVRPVCGASSDRVHGYHWRTVADVPVDVPVDGRRVVVRVGSGAWCVPRAAATTPSASRCPESCSDTSDARPA